MPIDFTLVDDTTGVEQLVTVIDSGASWNNREGSGWWGVVCPNDSLETKEGARAIRIIRDPDGTTTYI